MKKYYIELEKIGSYNTAVDTLDQCLTHAELVDELRAYMEEGDDVTDYNMSVHELVYSDDIGAVLESSTLVDIVHGYDLGGAR